VTDAEGKRTVELIRSPQEGYSEREIS